MPLMEIVGGGGSSNEEGDDRGGASHVGQNNNRGRYLIAPASNSSGMNQRGVFGGDQ